MADIAKLQKDKVFDPEEEKENNLERDDEVALGGLVLPNVIVTDVVPE